MEEFTDLWYGNFGRITDAEHQIALVNDSIRQMRSASYKRRPTAREFAATEIDRMLQEKIIVQTTTEWEGLPTEERRISPVLC